MILNSDIILILYFYFLFFYILIFFKYICNNLVIIVDKVYFVKHVQIIRAQNVVIAMKK